LGLESTSQEPGLSTRSKVLPIAWLVAPAGLFFLVFFVLPFGVMALFSVVSGNPVQRPNVTLTARHYERMLDDSLYVESLWSTLKIGAITTAAALLLGYPLAHWLARMRSRAGHALLLMAIIAPMLTGIVVRTFAWITILSDKGVINATLVAFGLAAAPLPLMYNELGTVIALVHIYVPFMVLTLAGVIGRVDERLEEAAMSLGASPIRAFLEVTLPLSLPGIIAGSLLVFALAISAYVTPYLMGGQQVLTLPMLIYQQVAATFNLAFAGALGVVLLAVSLVLVIAYNHILGRMARREDLA
jgi:putative spermidine/putrescine transport system permease protein